MEHRCCTESEYPTPTYGHKRQKQKKGAGAGGEPKACMAEGIASTPGKDDIQEALEGLLRQEEVSSNSSEDPEDPKKEG